MALYRTVLNSYNYIGTILFCTAVTGDSFNVKLSLFQKTLSFLKTFLLHIMVFITLEKINPLLNLFYLVLY